MSNRRQTASAHMEGRVRDPRKIQSIRRMSVRTPEQRKADMAKRPKKTGAGKPYTGGIAPHANFDLDPGTFNIMRR